MALDAPIPAPQACNEKVQTYLKGLYPLPTAPDLTSNWIRRMNQLTQKEMTARFKAVIVAAGTSN